MVTKNVVILTKILKISRKDLTWEFPLQHFKMSLISLI